MVLFLEAWDEDNSGWIDTGELRRVLKAIMPNFSDRDINDLLRVIDTNSNGVVEYEELLASTAFLAWFSMRFASNMAVFGLFFMAFPCVLPRFCQWLLKENPLDFSQSTFAAYVAQLMREAGHAKAPYA